MTERYFLLPREVIGAMAEARRAKLPFETGGFLLGSRRGNHVDVSGVTQQGAKDVATRSTFERADPSHEDQIHREWEATGGRSSLVGDWHSHPEGDGSPSGRDRAAWRKLTAANKSDCIGVIVTENPLPRVFLATCRKPFSSVIELRLVGDAGADVLFALSEAGTYNGK